MKIAIFGHKSIPNGSGGVEVVVEELAVRLAARGHSVTCLNRKGESGEKLRHYRGVRIKELPTVRRRGLAAASSSVFGAICAAFGDYDVVHIHAEGPAFMCWLPKLLGKRTVVTVHGLDHQRAKWGRFASRYIMCGEKNAVRWADEIIVLSRNVQEYFKKTYGRETVYIPNGMSRRERAEADEIVTRWGLQKDGYILFLGRLVPEKCPELLIKAFANVKTDKKLVIAGGSSDTNDYVNKLHALAAGDDRIVFTGFVSGRPKEELFSNACFYVIPSSVEGMPLTLLEAVSCGCCCLTSDIPECAEVVGDCALSFPAGDGAALTAALQSLCDEPERVESYRRLSEKVLENGLSWDEMTEKTLALYRGHE